MKATTTATTTTGETKEAATTTTATILKDSFKLPTHIPKDMLSEAVKICQLAKERNKYNHHKGDEESRPPCNHDRAMGWNLHICGDCNGDLSAVRYAQEEVHKSD